MSPFPRGKCPFAHAQGRRQVFELGANGEWPQAMTGWGMGRGSPFSPGVGSMVVKNFEVLLLKWCILKWCILARSERSYPPPEDFVILRQQQQTAFADKLAQYANRKYC